MAAPKRSPDHGSPLGVGQALDRIMALEDECERRIAKHADELRDDFAGRMAKLRERVPEDLRDRLDLLLVAQRDANRSARELVLGRLIQRVLEPAVATEEPGEHAEALE